MTKACSKCLLTKELSEFYKKGKGHDAQCSDCVKERRLRYRLANPEKCRESVQLASKRYYIKYQAERYKWRAENKQKVYLYNSKHKYGILPAEYEAMKAKQNGQCPGCTRDLTEVKRTCLDHCHRTGKIRGILCHQCNVVLGMAKDSKDTLERLRNYL